MKYSFKNKSILFLNQLSRNEDVSLLSTVQLKNFLS